MKLHIYLFRHGQTYFNRDKRFTGWKDSKLTPKGRADAKKLARELKSKKIDVAFVTRLSRSRDTMREVLKYHSECRAVITNDKMIERSYGKLAGQYHKDIIAKYGKERFDKWHRAYDFPPPGGESINMVEKRVLSFIKELLAFMKREKVNVAIAAHGNSIRPFRRYFEHLTIQQMTKLENPWDDYFDYVIEV
ncbi:MAG TPA: histidine phosphatase family protein [Candidatus Nanoarchaeia archaeon]|nr:histidine phosphatase family protein [Candidatus Nanoarchaeia archaeon]